MNIFKWLTNRKYRMFYKKIGDVQASIWEYDFKVAKARQMRENIRQFRDRSLEVTQKVKPMIDVEKDPSKKAEYEKDLAVHMDSISRYEGQIRMIDEQIVGVAANGDNPGQQGINDIIQGLAELREMYKEYLTQI